MCNNGTIQVRVTKQQKDLALLNMENAGFNKMSDYIRSLILNYGLAEAKMIREIHKKVVGCEDGKNKVSV